MQNFIQKFKIHKIVLIVKHLLTNLNALWTKSKFDFALCNANHLSVHNEVTWKGKLELLSKQINNSL